MLPDGRFPTTDWPASAAIAVLAGAGLLAVVVFAIRRKVRRSHHADQDVSYPVWTPSGGDFRTPSEVHGLLRDYVYSVNLGADPERPFDNSPGSKRRRQAVDTIRSGLGDHAEQWVALFHRNNLLVERLVDRSQWSATCARFEYPMADAEDAPDVLWIGVLASGERWAVVVADQGLPDPAQNAQDVDAFWADLLDTDTALCDRPAAGVVMISVDLATPSVREAYWRAIAAKESVSHGVPLRDDLVPRGPRIFEVGEEPSGLSITEVSARLSHAEKEASDA